MPNTTARMGIVTPLGTEAPNTDAAYKAIADQVDANAAMYGQGTFASRPTSTPGTPGKAGRFYVVNSGAELGQIWYDHGTGWIHLNPVAATGIPPGSIGTTELANGAVTLAKMANNSVTSEQIVDGNVGPGEIANTLRPSAGAGAGTESLRALGTGAGNAAAGNDARLSDARVPTDNSVSTVKLQDNAVTLAKMANDSVDSLKIMSNAVGSGELAPNSVDASKIIDGSVSAAEIATALQFTTTPDAIATLGSLADGASISVVTPITGTYLVSFGGGGFAGGGQGSGGNLTCNVVSGASKFSDVGGSGGPVTKQASLTTGQLVTITWTSGNAAVYVTDPWVRLTRIA